MYKLINYANILNNKALQDALIEIRGAYIDFDPIRWVRGLTNCSKAQEVFDLYTKERYGFEAECEINQVADEILENQCREKQTQIFKLKGGAYINAAAVNAELRKWLYGEYCAGEIAEYVALKTNNKFLCQKPENCYKKQCENCEAAELICNDVYQHLSEILENKL